MFVALPTKEIEVAKLLTALAAITDATVRPFGPLVRGQPPPYPVWLTSIPAVYGWAIVDTRVFPRTETVAPPVEMGAVVVAPSGMVLTGAAETSLLNDKVLSSMKIDSVMSEM